MTRIQSHGRSLQLTKTTTWRCCRHGRNRATWVGTMRACGYPTVRRPQLPAQGSDGEKPTCMKSMCTKCLAVSCFCACAAAAEQVAAASKRPRAGQAETCEHTQALVCNVCYAGRLMVQAGCAACALRGRSRVISNIGAMDASCAHAARHAPACKLSGARAAGRTQLEST